MFLAFGATWGMPLLFVISGIGSWYSLGSRGAAEFARERLRRLGVPLLVGLLTLVPLQVYLGRRRAGETSSYADFSARFWDVRPSLEFPFVVRADPAGGLFETGHLWFLVCLLGFSLVLLPGLVLLGRPPGRRLIERLAGLLARPGGLLLPVLPLAAVEVLRGSETGHGGWNDASYALFLVYGFLAAADPRIGQAFRRRYRAAMTLGGLGLADSRAPDPGLRAPRPRCAAWASRSTTPCRPSTCSTSRSWWRSPVSSWAGGSPRESSTWSSAACRWPPPGCCASSASAATRWPDSSSA